jgi:hypothetical protein
MPNDTKGSGGIEKRDFDEDTEEAIVLPKPTPEVTADDEKKADSAFDDIEIEVDEDEVKAESENQPSGRKY